MTWLWRNSEYCLTCVGKKLHLSLPSSCIDTSFIIRIRPVFPYQWAQISSFFFLERTFCWKSFTCLSSVDGEEGLWLDSVVLECSSSGYGNGLRETCIMMCLGFFGGGGGGGFFLDFCVVFFLIGKGCLGELRPDSDPYLQQSQTKFHVYSAQGSRSWCSPGFCRTFPFVDLTIRGLPYESVQGSPCLLSLTRTFHPPTPSNGHLSTMHL